MNTTINILKTFVVAAFLLLALAAVAANINLPFGYNLLVVQSGSMEPAISTGSLVLTKPSSDYVTPIPSARFSPGDVITFNTGKNTLVSHRIVEVEGKDSSFLYKTKGDANNNSDSSLVADGEVLGKVILTVPYLGRVPDFVKQPAGYFLLIVIPALYVIFSEIFSIWKELRKSNLVISRSKSNSSFVLPTVMSFVAVFYFVGGTAAYFSSEANSTNNVLSAADCFGEEGEVWGYEAVSENQGLKKNGNPVDANRSDPEDTIGPADGSGNPVSGFYSLGLGGEIILKFEYPVKDGEGDDLSFHEITNGRNSYPEETALIEVSQDGDDWEEAGTISSKDDLVGGISFLNLSSTSFESIQYVRITDTSDISIHASSADGFDLDAVDAVYGCVLGEQ